MRMPWGKHKGIDLEHLPGPYLAWILKQQPFAEHWPDLYLALEDEVMRRKLAKPDPETMLLVINTGYRILAREAHPDVGGDVQDMQILNGAVTWLRTAARKLAE